MNTRSFELLLGRTLGIGVLVSTVLLALGLLLSLVMPGAPANRLLDAGLVLLMATPMARVLLSCAEYVRERDWFFAVNAFGVLVVLAITVWTAWKQ
jgi:uncharacterized membrane protein